jgi:hypothetical protein
MQIIKTMSEPHYTPIGGVIQIGGKLTASHQVGNDTVITWDGQETRSRCWA